MKKRIIELITQDITEYNHITGILITFLKLFFMRKVTEIAVIWFSLVQSAGKRSMIHG